MPGARVRTEGRRGEVGYTAIDVGIKDSLFKNREESLSNLTFGSVLLMIGGGAIPTLHFVKQWIVSGPLSQLGGFHQKLGIPGCLVHTWCTRLCK